MWVSIIVVVALFAFGVGAAFMIMSDRMGGGSPTAAPTRDLAVLPPTQVAIISGTLTLTPNPTVTVSGTPTSTPTLTVTPTPSATVTPACSQQVEAIFQPYFNQEQQGCATTPAAIVWAAYQPFERGSMLWRSDSNTSYVFLSSGNWFPIELGWDGGPAADRGTPPPGLQAPQRGFGYVWSQDDTIFNGLGWARDQEKGFCALVQQFERGFILQSANVNSCTPENLYNFATAGDWTPLLFAAGANDQWRNAPSAQPPAPTSASPSTQSPTPPPAQQGSTGPGSSIARPAPNGIFDAHNATGFTVDGNVEEWPNAWIPINAVILGADRIEGPADLSANFQVGWTTNGLMLALRVNDDIYRAGPAGSDLWQGDSIEIQFDRQLAEDFNTTLADADDYQLGIAFDENLATIRGYLWLPYERESEIGIPSALTINAQGYQLEALIPWYVFEMDGAPASDRYYGFNISVNDNDSEAPAQEIVISASPARTTHDNPTEWGTLRILP